MSDDSREEERARNRREFPAAAAFLDRMRKVFGPGVRLVWWIEDGKSIGAVPDDMAKLMKKSNEGAAAGSCQIESSGTNC